MATRSLNKVQLIGNLTRDPELRYTPQGTPVCTFGLATNRQWVTEKGERKEETEFHQIVAWNKLAELCAQLLFKGRKVYVEGRLQTRRWTGPDGSERQRQEVVISDMMILDSRRAPGEEKVEEKLEEVLPQEGEVPPEELPPVEEMSPAESEGKTTDKASEGEVSGGEENKQEEEKVSPDDIPF
ncbi:MAG: single-stranded DNA-binding protein [Microgenomates group bacterium]